MNYGCYVTPIKGVQWITSVFATNNALPDNAFVLTAAQFETIGNTPGWSLVNGVPTAPPANYNLSRVQQQQIALVYQQLQAVLLSPYAFTTSGGVASSFPMDAVSQHNYSNAYTMYVLGGETLPSGFFFYDVNQTAVPFVVADIKALYLGAASREQGYYAAFEKAKTDILAATTVSGVQAISLSSP